MKAKKYISRQYNDLRWTISPLTNWSQITWKLYVYMSRSSAAFPPAKLSSCFTSLMRFRFRINWSLAPVASAWQLTCLTEYCLHMLFWSQTINIHDVCFTSWFVFGNIKMSRHFFLSSTRLSFFMFFSSTSPFPCPIVSPPSSPPLLLWRETAMSSGEAETHFSV